MNTGRKTDYLIAPTSEMERCQNCEKRFCLHRSEHVYKISGFGQRRYFCSWKCMEAWQKKQADQERDMKRTSYDQDTRDSERKTLEQWAEDAHVPYYTFWKLHRLNKISIRDSIRMLQGGLF